MDYLYGNKNKWRKEVIKTALDMLPIPRSEAICLYLAGVQDLERKNLVDWKGLKPANLIAIERNERVVKALRSQGVNVIHGSVNPIIYLWETPPISLLFLDFCSGFTKEAGFLMGSLMYSAGLSPKGTVIVLNMLRGRDAISNKRRNKTTEFLKNRQHSGFCGKVPENIDIEKHRGLLWLEDMSSLAYDFIEPRVEFAKNKLKKSPYSTVRDVMSLLNPVCVFESFRNPIFMSYKSNAGNQHFDTVIWLFKRDWRIRLKLDFHGEEKKYKNRITAVKAVRTRQFRKAA